MSKFSLWIVSSHELHWISCRFPDGHVETLHSCNSQRDADMFVAELKIKLAIWDESCSDEKFKRVVSDEMDKGDRNGIR